MTRQTKPLARAALTQLLLTFAGAACAAGPSLYETGPAQDSAFVRFINGADHAVEVVADGARTRLALPVDKPVGEFLSVRPDTVIKGAFEARGQRSAVAVKTAPGVFSTVVAWSAGAGKPLTTTVLSEAPDDFSALRASLAFASLDTSCAPAGLQTAAKGLALFSAARQGQLQRRQINPVQLSVQATCGGKPVGAAVDLGRLEAGQRYSVLLVPAAAGAGAPRVVFAVDAVAR